MKACEIISYLCAMKSTLKIKLLPTDKQANLLLETMKEANAVCNAKPIPSLFSVGG